MNEQTGLNRRIRVLVLMGGKSSERPVSLETGKMILSALDPAKYEGLGLDTDQIWRILPGAIGDPLSFVPDVVFIALHGKGGEDGTVQGLLECAGIRYTGSGVLASALAMNKSMSKLLFRADGLPVIESLILHHGDERSDEEIAAAVDSEVGFPVFVKPNSEGSTFGCGLAETPEALHAAVNTAFQFDSAVLVERYVKGTELTVGVLGNTGERLEVLPVVQIIPKNVIYDYESKYTDGGSEHIIPAAISEELTKHAQEIALRCHSLLGCRGMSRTDLILRDGELYLLETNTIPGMTPFSLLPQAAANLGITFPILLSRIISDAIGSSNRRNSETR